MVVRKTEFPWLQRNRPLVRAKPAAQREGVAVYGIALSFNGVPFKLTPRSAREIKAKSKCQWQNPAPALCSAHREVLGVL